MVLRRGFKTEANHIAREVRAELGLRFIDPLDPWALARHLEIQVVPLSSYAGLGAARLISEEAALGIARSRQAIAEAARMYRVSQAMMTFRLNVTAAQRRVGPSREPSAAMKRTRNVRETQG